MSMLSTSHVVVEPLVQEALRRHATRGKKILVVVLLTIGIVLCRGQHGDGWGVHLSAIQSPSVATPSMLSRWHPRLRKFRTSSPTTSAVAAFVCAAAHRPAPKEAEGDELLAWLRRTLADANRASQRELFVLDASMHRRTNPEATVEQVAPEAMAYLDTGLKKCVEKLVASHALLKNGPVVLYLHPPVFTCDQAERLCQADMRGMSLKNLFCRDKKKNYYLLTARVDTATNLKAVATAIKHAGMEKPKGGLSFASTLTEVLKLLPGSVTPMGLLNDGCANSEQRVKFFLDNKTFADDAPGAPFVSCHPNACHASLSLHRDDLVAFLEITAAHKVTVLEMSGGDGGADAAN